jgi:hypothetical protein
MTLYILLVGSGFDDFDDFLPSHLQSLFPHQLPIVAAHAVAFIFQAVDLDAMVRM